MAADLPKRTAPAPMLASVPFSWEGAYVGLQAGYGLLNAARSYTGSGGFSTPPGPNSGSGSGSANGSHTQNASGALGGGQIGYNKQFQSIVVGVEADLALASIKGTALSQGPAYSSGNGNNGGTTSVQSSSRLTGFGTARLRVGYAVDKALFYVTGGLAYAKLKNSSTFSMDTSYWSGSVTSTQSRWKTGWTVGGGMEYALNEHWSVKTEALYYNLGKKNFTVYQEDNVSGLYHTGRVKTTGVIARVGVNFRF